MLLKVNLYSIIFCVLCNISALGQVKAFYGKTISEKEMDAFVKKQMDSLNMPGLSMAVINNGKIVYSRASGLKNRKTGEKVDNQTLFEAASMSKPVFAFFVMKLVENGILDLDTPLYKYLPLTEISDERHKLITAAMVLSHTTGLPNWRYMNEGGQLGIKFTPGTQFEYSGEGYLYLSKVIAHLTGTTLQNLDSVFQKMICAPLGLKHFYFNNNDYLLSHIASPHVGDTVALEDISMDRNSFSAAGGLRTEAMNFAQFLIAIMNEQGLQKKTCQKMLSQVVKLPEENLIRKYVGYTGWTLGFAEKDSPDGRLILHAGNNWGFQSAFIINPKLKSGYVFFTNSDKGNDFGKNIETLMVGKMD